MKDSSTDKFQPKLHLHFFVLNSLRKYLINLESVKIYTSSMIKTAFGTALTIKSATSSVVLVLLNFSRNIF